MSTRETSAEIDEAAALWATRLDEAVLTDDEQAEFNAWLHGDTRRVGAVARAQAVLVHVKRAKALGTDFEPEAFATEPDADRTMPEASADMPAQSLLTRRKLLVGASAVAATGAVAFFIPTRHASAVTYETGRGEIRLVPLSDGSTVTLNTDSGIAVSTDDARPRVQLLRGEALFTVAAAERTPFIVEAGHVSLRARNATFAICQLDKRPLEIKVCEGSVELTRNAFLGDSRHRLDANMRATLAPDGSFVDRNITQEALQRDLAWQEGMLSFMDTPLSQAAEQFARYSDRQIHIPDPTVGAETITGLYAANNPEGFAQAVALSLNLHMQKTSSGIILAR